MFHRQQHGNRLERAGGAEGVTGDALRRCDRHSPLAEHLGDGCRLGSIVERGGRAVGIDVADVARLETGVVEGQPHARDRAGATRSGRGDVMGVGVAGSAQHLAEDVCTSALGSRPFLEDQRCCALAEHEPVPVDVERPARTGSRQRGHVAEAGDADRTSCRFRSARDDGIAHPPGDQAAAYPMA